MATTRQPITRTKGTVLGKEKLSHRLTKKLMTHLKITIKKAVVGQLLVDPPQPKEAN